MDKLTLFYKYLQFADTAFFLSLFFFFNKWKVCGNPGPSRSLGTIFPAAFAPLMSLPHFGNSRSISHFTYHYYICYVVSDLCSTTTHWSLRWWLAFFKSWSISKLKYVHFFQTVLLYTSQPVVKMWLLCALRNQRIWVIHFIQMFSLLRWSGAEHPLSPWCACMWWRMRDNTLHACL